MKTMRFVEAIESALAQAMAEDETIFIMGEDVHALRVNLFTQFGNDRVLSTPISESAFLGAAVTAALAGLKPVVEIMLADFIGVAMDALLNHAAKVASFSGGKWHAPVVIRTACGGGYGDAGQHEQSLWGWLAHIPGISIVVPSTPADAGGLMLTALAQQDPVVFFEHKLLADNWRDYLAGASRSTVSFDVPTAGVEGEVPDRWEPLDIGKCNVVSEGTGITLVSVSVGVHRCLEAAEILAQQGISAEVIDLRSLVPLDVAGIRASVEKTGALVVVDEDYQAFGLSGEVCACLAESGLTFKFDRVCTGGTIPFARALEDQVLPSTSRIVEAAKQLLGP